MQREAICQLTTKDMDILMTMLDRTSGSSAFVRLLRNKLNFATIYFRDDIPDDVVTLNSRVLYSVDSRRAGPHIVVQSPPDDLPDFALSIHTMRGLGLLGLSVGDIARIDYGDDRRETLAVEALVYQPEADLRDRDYRPPAPTRRDPHDPASRLSGVVPFRQRSRYRADNDPDGDDPGPQAA